MIKRNHLKLILILALGMMPVTAFAQTLQYTMEHNDIERQYQLFVPEHYDLESSGRLLMVLHGGGMTSIEMVNHTGRRFNELVDENRLNVIVVYPAGVDRGWNDGRIREGRVSYDMGIDDVDFLLTLADTLATDYNIQADQLFLTGFSNGAAMSYRVACEYPQRVVAIAPVSNLIAGTVACEPELTVALLSIIGDEDPILPLTGGDLFYWDTPLGNVLSLEDTLAIWHDVGECEGYDDRVDLPDTDPDDGTTVSVIEALNCQQPLISMIIHGGEHTWANSARYQSVETFGRTSKDVDASEVIFEFFMQVGLG